MADEKLLPRLSQNLLEILDDSEYYDITVEVGNDPYVKTFRAHMVILYYRSSYLRRILSTIKKKKDETLVHIKLPNILPEIFQVILRYIYGGRISLEEYDTQDIIKILVSADELGLQGLISYIQYFLIQNKSKWVKQNFNFIYHMSFENNSFLELQKFCTELMSKEPENFFESFDFISISEKSLISLIQHDNLQLSAVQVWEYVLKWGIAQNPRLSLDPSYYSNEDFITLRNTLQHLIPFIKFVKFTSKEFLNKVYPYKNIMPEEVFENLVKYFLNNDYRNPTESQITKKISIDSKIITHQHAELITRWIDRSGTTDETKNFYELNLIFRGSRDGFAPEKFHEICDNQFHTVSIIKVKGSNEILGGYNPIKWEVCEHHSSYGTTKNSFIFSFINGGNDYILSRVKEEKYAIRYRSDFGPSFGGDLVMKGDFYNENLCCCKNKSYEKPIRRTEEKFCVEEYEVFQIFQIIKD